MMAPLVKQIASEFAGQIKVGVVDSGEQMELARRLKINAIPTFFIYRNGEVVDRFQGVISREKLVERLGLGV
jgi:thioredoxin 1